MPDEFPVPSLDDLSGVQYTVGDELARGAFGAVYAARDCRLHRTVALKTLLDESGGQGQNRRRFIQEARVLGRLQHPNIVPIHDLGVDESGRAFYTMKFVKGSTLRDVLGRLRDGDRVAIRDYSLTRLLVVFQKICDAMAFAHARGVLHRDLKPANLMLGEFGSVMVMDWGLAKVTRAGQHVPQMDAPFPLTPTLSPGEREAEANARNDSDARTSSTARGELPPLPEGEGRGEGERDALAPETPLSSESSSDVTMDGALLGTPTFMSPEQAQGRIHELDERTDIFALGAILYNILTLRLPVPGNSVEEVLSNAQSAYIPPPLFYNKSAGFDDDGNVIDTPADLPHITGGKVPEPLSAVAMKALAPNPADRYQNVGELQADVAAFLGGFATTAERPSLRRQVALTIRRHKGRFVAGTLTFVVFNAILLFLFWRLVESERHVTASLKQAEMALGELRRTEPLLRTETISLIQQQRFPEALEKADYLVLLAPTSADYAALRGNVLQSLRRFDEAQAAYAKALELDPAHAGAKENRVLSEHLQSVLTPDGKLPESAVKLFGEALTKQGRNSESSALLKESGASNQQLIEQWKAALLKAGLPEAQLGKLNINDVGELELDLSGVGLTDLQFLAGIPIQRLQLAGNKLSDLGPLTGMPLVRLGIASTEVTDLSPLRGMPLENFSMHHTRIADLSPLRGMPLTSLNMGFTPVADLRAVEGLPLKTLHAQSTPVSDLGPLKGMRLEVLRLERTKVADLSPLAGMPLKELDLNYAPIDRVDALKGMVLEQLNLNSTKVTDLTPLKGMPLRVLGLSNTKVRDLRLLAEMPLEVVHLGSLDVRSLEMLRGKQLRWMSLDKNSGLADISVLRGMPLQTLWLNGTAVRDFTPLLACPQLEQLLVPTGAPGIEVLRRHPGLKRISFTASKNISGEWTDLPTPEEFWRTYDAQKQGTAPK